MISSLTTGSAKQNFAIHLILRGIVDAPVVSGASLAFGDGTLLQCPDADPRGVYRGALDWQWVSYFDYIPYRDKTVGCPCFCASASFRAVADRHGGLEAVEG